MPLQAVKSFIAEHSVSGSVLAGFSGGADSTALLLALHEAGMDVTAVHFNHGIRGDEADADEEWSRNFCEARGIPFISEHLNVPANTRKGESCEEAARRLRIESWKRLANGRPVFIAHHADDTLEELFLRLARGSNVSALVPMRPVRVIYGVTFLRPFLRLRKSRLEAWLRSRGVSDWRIDSTNNDNSYRRNAVRNRLLPLFSEIFGNDTGLLLALDSLREDAALIDNLVEKAPADSINDWKAMPRPVFARRITRWLRDNDVTSPVTRPFIERLFEATSAFNGRELTIPLDIEHSISVTATGPVLLTDRSVAEQDWNWRTAPLLRLSDTFSLRAEQTENGIVLTETNSGKSETFSSLPDTLRVRSWRQGDRMLPFGSQSPKKLQDIFSDAKVPRHLRPTYPVILADDTIIWLAPIRRAEFGRLTTSIKNQSS